MMKRKLFFASLLCLVWFTMASTTGAVKKPRSNHFVLETSLLLPGMADSTAPKSGGFSNLFDEDEAGTTSAEVRLNPRAIKFVEDYMEKHGEDLLEMKDWGRPYFNMMDGILSRYGLLRSSSISP